MADAGEVKARVTIEYNGDGIKQAKEDLASLAEAAGSAGESAGQAGEKIAGLGESMSSNAGGAKELSAALEELPKIAEGGTSAVAEMSGVLEEHRAAVEETGTAYESLQKPIESTTSAIEKTAPAMQVASEHTRGLNENISQVQQSFSDLSTTIAEPGATEAYTKLWESISGQSLGASPLGNFEVFQKAYNAVDASGMYDLAGGMQMIDEHLDRTGQSYEQFAGTLSDKNQQLLHEMSMDWSQMNATMDGTGQVFQKTGEKAQSGFNTIASSADGADQAVAEFLGKTNKSVAELGGEMKPVTLGGAFGEVMSGVTGVLNDIAMPLMAVQMIGMAIGQVGQAMYDSAAIAEGPAAHSFGSFTGTVDALGQSLQKASGQFSEGFGQALIPTLNALNNQAGSSDLGGLGQFVGGVASTLTNLSLITTGIDPWGGVQGLINQGAAMIGVQQPFQGPAPVSQYQQQMNALPQTVRQNTQQLQYQADLTLDQAVDPNWLAANNQNMASQRAAQYLIANYNSAHPISMHQAIQQAQEQYYDAQQMENYQYQMNNQPPVDIGGYWGGVFGSIGNYLNTPTGSLLFGGIAPGGLMNSIASNGGIGSWLSGLTSPTGDLFSGIFGGHSPNLGDIFGGIGSWFNGLFGGGESTPPTFSGGCFIAGTPVLMVDGSSKPIEMLRVDERVLAHDGKKQVPATIIGCIMFPAKQTYALTFSDGNTLLTTDSHPIGTPQGWKSISPESTAQENPGLPVTALAVGDNIYTAAGTLCRLISIQQHEIAPVYNITVNPHHTYYAAGILVHNAKASNIGPQIGQQASEQISGIQLPHMDLSGMASQLGGSFSGIQLPHMDLSGLSAGLGGAFSGIQLPHIDLSGIASGLGGAFAGISLPHIDLSGITSSLSGAFGGISLPSIPDIGGMINSQLGGMFGGITLPSLPDVGGMLNGALSGMFGGITVPSPPDVGGMISGAVSSIFGGVDLPSPPDVGGMITGAMSGMFGGIQVPSPPDLGGMINSAMSGMFSGISIPSVPFFASGVSNFAGGGAVVGEEGAEIAEYNGRYALFDQGATFVNLPAGSSVYPMQELNSYSSPRMMADGTGGGGFTPLSIGGGGMSGPINVHVHIGAETIISSIGIPLAQDVRVASGLRSY